jgi:endonuclease G
LYFIPGKQNGDSNHPKKPKKRLPVILAAVFLFIFIAFTLFRYNKPLVTRLLQKAGKGHGTAIDSRLLENKNFGLPQVHSGDEIIRHFAYTLSYSEKDEEAFWVAYALKSEYLAGTEKRTNHFNADPDVPTGSADPDDYRNSGFDKGHLAPAADMKWNAQAMEESFLLSNVAPQDHKFNEGIWADLEKAVRKWARSDGAEYIVTGPVLPDASGYKIGKDHVTVPSFFYKVVFSPTPYPKAVGFIIPNQPGRQSFWHYACTLSQVETQTHIKFFPMLPDNISNDIKNHFEISDWRSTEKF